MEKLKSTVGLVGWCQGLWRREMLCGAGFEINC